MPRTPKITKPQRRTLDEHHLIPCYGSGLRCTVTLDDCGTLWVEQEYAPFSDLEKQIAAEYGWICRTYLVRKNGKLERPNCWTPNYETAAWAMSHLPTRLPN